MPVHLTDALAPPDEAKTCPLVDSQTCQVFRKNNGTRIIHRYKAAI